MLGLLVKLEEFAKSENSKVLYVLTVIAVAMIVDFVLGYLGAWLRKEATSKKGIDGILRKVASIIMLMFAIPLAPIIPGGAGVAALYVLYIGYLMMELTSIVENYRRLGGNANIFAKYLGMEKNNPDKPMPEEEHEVTIEE